MQYSAQAAISLYIMTSSIGNIFRVTGHLCGEFTGHRWIPYTKASEAELWCFLWSAPEESWGLWFETQMRPLWRHCNEWWCFRPRSVLTQGIHNSTQSRNKPLVRCQGNYSKTFRYGIRNRLDTKDNTTCHLKNSENTHHYLKKLRKFLTAQLYISFLAKYSECDSIMS